MPVVTDNVEILHRAQMGQDVYIYGIRTYQTYIYTYRQFSVFTTSVGLAALAPISTFNPFDTTKLAVSVTERDSLAVLVFSVCYNTGTEIAGKAAQGGVLK